MKIIKRILLIIIGIIIVIFIGLIINNRVYYFKYKDADVEADTLTKSDLKAVEDVYSYLGSKNLLNGFDEKSTDLIIYNAKYEFLFSNIEETSGWEYIGYNKDISRYIYRRLADNPQAFASKVDNRWVGSFNTRDFYCKSIIEDYIPIFYPPQLLIGDEEYYKSMIIHEMTHAFEGNLDYRRVDNDEHLADICQSYYDNKEFNTFITEEGKYLEEAIKSDNIDEVKENAAKFLEQRRERRSKSNMSVEEIRDEKEFEWLEGIARYTEYLSSRESGSMIAKNLDHIEEKTANKNDDRYYALGMAQAIILDKLGYNWQEKVFINGGNLEDTLRTALNE